LTCVILAIALHRIRKTMLEYSNIGMSIARLIVHVGSFSLYLVAFILTDFLHLYNSIKSEGDDHKVTFWIEFFQIITGFVSQIILCSILHKLGK